MVGFCLAKVTGRMLTESQNIVEYRLNCLLKYKNSSELMSSPVGSEPSRHALGQREEMADTGQDGRPGAGRQHAGRRRRLPGGGGGGGGDGSHVVTASTDARCRRLREDVRTRRPRHIRGTDGTWIRTREDGCRAGRKVTRCGSQNGRLIFYCCYFHLFLENIRPISQKTVLGFTVDVTGKKLQ